MPRLIQTDDIERLIENHELSAEGIYWCYNAIDCMVTHEVDEALDSSMDPIAQAIYDFEMVQQGPALSMMTTGIRIDRTELAVLASAFKERMNKLETILNIIVKPIWGPEPFNPMSEKQVKELFYERMDVKPVTKYDHKAGKSKVTSDEKALEKIRDRHYYAGPIAGIILRYKEIHGQLKVLRSGIEPDGRMRISFNVGGTETGRWSSSKNVWGGGTNGQNITPAMRSVFVADQGMKLCYADLEQAESRVVAYRSGDENYIKACETGDLHTAVCQMMYPSLPWTGDLQTDREMCESKMFDAIHSYRFMAKSNGHATNYGSSHISLAARAKIPEAVALKFQEDYFGAFPGIRAWHDEVATQLQLHGVITTALGRRRQFFGRRTEDSTLREAIAFEPQSIVADILNMAMLRVWSDLQVRQRLVQLLAQVHDAILLQYPEELDDKILPRLQSLMRIPVKIQGRVLTIPVECKVGYDWYNMADWRSSKAKNQVRRSESILDRIA